MIQSIETMVESDIRNSDDVQFDDANEALAVDKAVNANGLLTRAVYAEIYRQGKSCKGDCFLEIGTAHGAATIALMLGAKSAGKDATIVSVDQFEGTYSSRSKFGSPADNEQIVRNYFDDAGISPQVDLFVGTSDELVGAGKIPETIDLLVLDADGRIDRDLIYFYDKLVPNAKVIIDDVDPVVTLGCNHEKSHFVDLKHRITWLLLDAIESEGYLIVEKRIGNTAFCRKSSDVLDLDQFRDIALGCYRQLVFSELNGHVWPELLDWHGQRERVRQSLRIRSKIPEFIFSCWHWARRLWASKR